MLFIVISAINNSALEVEWMYYEQKIVKLPVIVGCITDLAQVIDRI
jgi:hypothetical protein